MNIQRSARWITRQEFLSSKRKINSKESTIYGIINCNKEI